MNYKILKILMSGAKPLKNIVLQPEDLKFLGFYNSEDFTIFMARDQYVLSAMDDNEKYVLPPK